MIYRNILCITIAVLMFVSSFAIEDNSSGDNCIWVEGNSQFGSVVDANILRNSININGKNSQICTNRMLGVHSVAYVVNASKRSREEISSKVAFSNMSRVIESDVLLKINYNIDILCSSENQNDTIVVKYIHNKDGEK